MNLYTFPFGEAPGQLPDPADCPAWPDFALTAPGDRFLPFCVKRPLSDRFINCVRILDADTLLAVRTNVPFPAGVVYEKYQDVESAYEYFLYYGALVPGLNMPFGRRVRLEVDGYLSAPFMACSSMSSPTLQVRWQHASPLYGVPYGTGLEQVLYLPGIKEGYAEAKRDRRVSKNENGSETLDFLALTPQSTFTAVLLPAWLAQALTLAEAHDTVTVNGRPIRSDSLTAKTDATDDSCRVNVTLTFEEPDTLVRRGCGSEQDFELVPVPEDFEPRGWECGDSSDTAPDFRRLVPAVSECEQDLQPNWQRKVPAETECEQD